MDIRKLIANAYSEFGDATNERKVSIAIQCGFFCQQVFVESFGCPSELLSLWKIALQDGDVKVRQAAVTGLHLCTPPNASEFSDEIRRVAVDNKVDRDHQREAWVVLARVGEQDGIQWLARQLQDKDTVVREMAAKELQNVNSKQLVVLADIRNRLHDDSDIVRVAVASLLWEGEGNATDTVPVLLDVVTNKGSTQRLEAARLLCRMKQSARVAMSNLIALRDENEWTLRLQAVRAIRMIGQFDEVAMEVLTALSNDANQFVAREARETLRTAY